MTDPYIVENGAAIYGESLERVNGEIILGIKYESLEEILNFISIEINYQLNDNDLPKIFINDFNAHDYLTSSKYNCKNISLDPFQVIWLGAL